MKQQLKEKVHRALRDSLPLNEYSVSYSPSCCSNPGRLLFIGGALGGSSSQI